LPVGTAVSSTMPSLTGSETWPAASLNCAYTVFGPSPAVSVHETMGAYGCHLLKLVVAEFVNCICEHPAEPGQVRFSVTGFEGAAGALLLIAIVPQGSVRKFAVQLLFAFMSTEPVVHSAAFAPAQPVNIHPEFGVADTAAV